MVNGSSSRGNSASKSTADCRLQIADWVDDCGIDDHPQSESSIVNPPIAIGNTIASRRSPIQSTVFNPAIASRQSPIRESAICSLQSAIDGGRSSVGVIRAFALNFRLQTVDGVDDCGIDDHPQSESSIVNPPIAIGNTIASRRSPIQSTVFNPAIASRQSPIRESAICSLQSAIDGGRSSVGVIRAFALNCRLQTVDGVDDCGIDDHPQSESSIVNPPIAIGNTIASRRSPIQSTVFNPAIASRQSPIRESAICSLQSAIDGGRSSVGVIRAFALNFRLQTVDGVDDCGIDDHPQSESSIVNPPIAIGNTIASRRSPIQST